jgi:hypothetical protein
MAQDTPQGRPPIRTILTGEEMKGLATDAGLSMSDLASQLAPISGLPGGVLHVAMEAGGALGRSFGFTARKKAETRLAASYPTAVRALVFALHSIGRELTAAFDTPAGAYFEAKLPGDIFSPGGSLQFDVIEERPGAVRIAGASEIKGQMYDWGKGKRALADVFEKTEAFAKRLGG